MKTKILYFILGLLLISINHAESGDFTVDGKVGIGTETLTHKLNVVGDQNLTGALFFGDHVDLTSGGNYGAFGGHNIWGTQMWAGDGSAFDWTLCDVDGNIAM